MTSLRARTFRVRTARLLTAALAAPLVTGLVLAGSAATAATRAATRPALNVSKISFEPKTVDATSGTATAKLRWTVLDSDLAATQVQGTVHLQQFTAADVAVGPEQVVRYALTWDGIATVIAESGDAQNSRYAYDFAVPQYGPTTSATWRVTEITASDDRGNTLTQVPSRSGATLSVTELVDSTAPEVTINRHFDQPDAEFDDGSGAELKYTLFITDPEAGFWKGRLRLSGPGGAQAAADIVIQESPAFLLCGDTPVFDLRNVLCTITVVLPANSPSGTWSVAAVELTDNAGNSTTTTDLPALPIYVTRNDVLSATGFAVDPIETDNWREPQSVTLSLTPVGAQDGLTTMWVRGDTCFGPTTTPTVHPDGTVSVPVTMPTFASACRIIGIQLIDGAGNQALYGVLFSGPDPGLVITRIPDDTPPLVLTAELTDDTIAQSEQPARIGVDVVVDASSGAPVDAFSVTFYDSEGAPVAGASGGIHEEPGGVLLLEPITVDGLSPGVYTAGFTLYDAAGNFAQYGYPGVGLPVPGGPLELTITPG